MTTVYRVLCSVPVLSHRALPMLLPRLGLSLLLLALAGCSSLISATRDEPIRETPTKRTFGAVIEDQTIETKAAVNLEKASSELADSHIAVVSYNGVALLVGQVPSAEQRKLAASTVADLRQVRRVHNALEVAGKTTYVVRTNDAWITAKVKAKLLANQELAGRRIKVVTENGAVYLMGLISRADADRAAEIARGTNGAQKVVRLFEYTD